MMKKDFKVCPVTKFIAWLILGLIVCIIGISNVFADTYNYSQFTAQLYDNYGPTLSGVTTDFTNGRWQGTIPTMTANSSGAAWGVSSPVVLLSNHTYSISLKISGPYGGNIVLSTYNRIGVGTTLANAKTSYQNNSYVTENYSRVVDGDTIQYAFTPTINASYFVIPFATSSSGSNYTFYLENIVIDDLGSSGGVSESTINNSLNSQTNVLNQSITNSQNAIIQNQNENNEELQNTITDSFNNCITNLIDDSNYLVGSNTRWVVNNYDSTQHQIQLKAIASGTGGKFPIYWELNLKPNTYYTFQVNNAINGSESLYYYIYTNGFSDTLFYYTETSGLESFTFQTNSNTTYYFQVYISGTTNINDTITLGNISLYEGQTGSSEFIPYGSPKCVNKLDNLNSTLTDDTAPTFDTSLINISPNTPISNILLLPINLLNSILTKSQDQCSSISVPFLFNTNITFPCFTISDYLGQVANTIDLCICFVMIYNILMLFVSVFEDITTLRDGFLSLYEPRHAYTGYHPKHGKE